MTLHRIIKQAQKLAVDNSPGLLTGFGVVGTLTTAYLTGQASFKAAEVLQAERTAISLERTGQPDNPFGIEMKDAVRITWKLYIPASISAATTISCIVFANRIGTRRAAAMAAAYTITDKAFTEYKEKVVETIGKNKEEKIRASVQQDRIDREPPSRQTILVANGGDSLCKDAWSGRYFSSDMETIKKAQNDTNYEVLNHGYASLTDFYSRLGLEGTKESDNVGWNSDNLLEVTFTSAISDEDKPVLVMDFAVAPVRNFFRGH